MFTKNYAFYKKLRVAKKFLNLINLINFKNTLSNYNNGKFKLICDKKL